MSARLCGGGLGVLSDQRDQDQGTKMPEPGTPPVWAAFSGLLG